MKSVKFGSFLEESYGLEKENNGNPDLVSFNNITEIFL